MKKLLTFVFSLLSFFLGQSQTTNTFPSTGSAGIGTLTPTKALDIRVSNAGDGLSILSSNQSAAINLKGNGGHKWAWYSLGTGDGWCGAGGLALQDVDGDASYPRFLIDPSGNVGIGGVTSPGSKMHISTGTSTSAIGLMVENTNSTVAWGQAAQINVSHDATKALTIHRVSGGTATAVFHIWGNGVVNTKKLYSEAITVISSAIGIYWPDYVFNKNYKLTPLLELEKYIQENHHLPNIPSAAEVQKEGLDLYEINRSLVEKVEELSLHLIALKKEIEEIKKNSPTSK